MSGIRARGLIMVQEAAGIGFKADVYDDHLSAAIQLLRISIRRPVRTNECKAVIAQIEQQVADLIASERADLEENQNDQQNV